VSLLPQPRARAAPSFVLRDCIYVFFFSKSVICRIVALKELDSRLYLPKSAAWIYPDDSLRRVGELATRELFWVLGLAHDTLPVRVNHVHTALVAFGECGAAARAGDWPGADALFEKSMWRAVCDYATAFAKIAGNYSDADVLDKVEEVLSGRSSDEILRALVPLLAVANGIGGRSVADAIAAEVTNVLRAAFDKEFAAKIDKMRSEAETKADHWTVVGFEQYCRPGQRLGAPGAEVCVQSAVNLLYAKLGKEENAAAAATQPAGRLVAAKKERAHKPY
jgi:hypothetical protein